MTSKEHRNSPQAAAEAIEICSIDDIPVRGSRIVAMPAGEIALFRTAEDEVFALANRCPHAGGPLSQGIVHGKAVTCPLHNWVISLETGAALGADKGQVPRVPLTVKDRKIFIRLTDFPKARPCKAHGAHSPPAAPERLHDPGD